MYMYMYISSTPEATPASLKIARRSLGHEKLGSNPGQGSKGINLWAGMVSICLLM